MPEDLKVKVKRGNGYAVVQTDGYISHIGGEKVAEECYRLLEEGNRHFILNLAKSRVVNSIGISILIEIIERVRSAEGALSFCNLTPTVGKTFRIMRLTDASDVYENEEEAIDALAS